MHTFGESSGSGVPAFLAKLWRLVEDNSTNGMIHWSADGRSFIIQNQAQFARDLLPLNYKHNNMASFIRQLNMYGFHKITSIDNGGLKFDRDEMEFSHPCFKRGHAYLLEHIKRKIANTKTAEEKTMKPETVSKVLTEVKQMRGRQESMDSRFSSIKQENESLWREIAVLRQKHIKQQQIVNKLIQFLVTIVQPQRTGLGNMGGMKRRFQLMINDVPQSSKMQKSDDNGPVIRELTEGLLGEVQTDDDDELMSDEVHSQHTMSPEGLDLGAQIEDISSPGQAERPQSAADGSDELIQMSESFRPPQSKRNNKQNKYDYYVVDHIDESGGSDSEQNMASPQYNGGEYDDNVLNTPMVKKALNKSPHNTRKRANSNRSDEYQAPLKVKINRKSKSNKNSTSELPLMEKSSRKTRKSQAMVTTTVDPQKQQLDELLVPKLEEMSDQQMLQPQVMQMQSLLQQLPETNADKPTYTNKDSFISTDIPTDLFDVDDSSLLNDFNISEQDQLPNNYTNDNMLTYNGSKMNDPTISGATGDGNASLAANNNDGKQMTLAKYNNNDNACNGITDDEILRLNSPDEINSHLDGVQGDLDSLKELLRGEGYTLDANALMGAAPGANERKFMLSPSMDSFSKLFGDNDLLSPYNLAFNQDLPNEKKNEDPQASGSELMTYQPYPPELSDLLTLNNEVNSPVGNILAFDDDNSLPDADTNIEFGDPPPSVLDSDDDLQTPCHENNISFSLK